MAEQFAITTQQASHVQRPTNVLKKNSQESVNFALIRL
jgi:hypothetical protein